jgi:hypothetical protein
MDQDNAQLVAQLQAQLQDIHGAGNPGWWPPAPGWWVLAVLVLILLFLAGRFSLKKLRTRRRRRRFLAEIERLRQEFDPSQQAREYLAGVNRVFRVVAMRAFPDTACASMQGEDWVTFVRSLLPAASDTSSLSVLAHGPYELSPSFDHQVLDEHARTWIRLYG